MNYLSKMMKTATATATASKLQTGNGFTAPRLNWSCKYIIKHKAGQRVNMTLFNKGSRSINVIDIKVLGGVFLVNAK